MTAPARLRQDDITRAIKAYAAFGQRVMIEALPDGTTRIIPIADDAPAGVQFDPYMNGVENHAKGRRRAPA